MRKILLYAALLLGLTASAQKEFPLEWKGAFPVSTEWKMINEERTLALGGDLTELAMIDALTGKLLWQCTFKEKFGTKKAKDWNWNKDKGAVYVVFKGENKNEEVTHYIDERTGASISKEQYALIKTKPVNLIRKGVLSIGETTVSLEYERKKVVSSMGKGSKGSITVKANGTHNWNTTIEARYVRTLCTNAMPEAAAEFGGDFLKIMYEAGKVFVLYEGLSVLDLQTGKLLWQADLDNAEFDFGMFKSTQTLGRAGIPLVTNDAVYVADLSKNQYCIKKYAIETGKLLWQSPPFGKDDIVPDMQVSNGMLLAQFGGRLQVQSYIPGTSGRPDVCKSEAKFAGNAAVKAYGVSTGKLLWETTTMKELNDKFSGTITNIIAENNKAYVASDKNFYSFDATSGKPLYTTPVSKLKIGKPVTIFKHDQAIIIRGDEGIASVNIADGKVNYALNTKKCLSAFFEGNAFFVWNGKDADEFSSFVRIDLDAGKILGQAEDTAYPYFTADGESFVKFSGEKIMRYRTR